MIMKNKSLENLYLCVVQFLSSEYGSKNRHFTDCTSKEAIWFKIKGIYRRDLLLLLFLKLNMTFYVYSVHSMSFKAIK